MAMVRSTFAGFTTAQLALAASQRSIDAVGQNISNVNTEGYTRQRIDLASISPTGSSYFMMQTDIRVGQGVQMTDIIQIRDPFLDVQYRNQLAKVGTIDAKDSVLTDIGGIFDEVDKTAVLAALNDVVSQLNIMANPDSANQGSSDTLVRSSMETLLNVIHENVTKLEEVRSDEEMKLESTDIPNINEYLESIRVLNSAIKNTQILGGAALELQDERNQLIDELSTYLPISVTYRELNIGAGIVVNTLDISFTDTDNNTHLLVSDDKDPATFAYIPDDGSKQNYGISITDVKGVTAEYLGVTGTDALGEGVLRGTLESLNKSGNDNTTEQFKGIGYYEKMFDAFVNTFATKLNELNIAASPGGTADDALFQQIDDTQPLSASNIKISDRWMNGETQIYTVDQMEEQDTGNLNVLKMINAISTDVWDFTDPDGNVLFTGNCFDAYSSLQTTQAIDKKATDSILNTRTAVLNDIANSKDSVSGVWMDEEVMDLMQFSQSYNAAAQLMTTYDELLVTLLGIKR